MAEYHEVIKDIAPKTIVYIDEMGIDTFIYRPYAYAKRGVKVTGRISGKKFKRTSIVAAKMNGTIIAPLQYQGSMDSKLFEYWFEFCLIPILPISSTIVLDNASFHSKKRLALFSEKYGHKVIFLPPTAPSLTK